MSTTLFETRPERRRAKPSVLLIALAILSAEVTGLVTLCPISLRPHLWSANHERFAAYFVLGALIALAAQRRRLGALALVIFLAFGLEAAQRLVPGRHAMLSDAAVKALGGVLGCAAAQVGFPLRRLLAGAPAPARPTPAV
jgi:VanZ family protein